MTLPTATSRKPQHRFGASKLTMLQARRLGQRAGVRSGRFLLIGEVNTIRPGMRENGNWSSGSLHVEGAPHLVGFVAKGVGGLEVGRSVEVEGYWGDHPEYGVQFYIDQVLRTALPRETKALIRYLSANVPGVGKARAKTLVRICGTDVLERLASEPSLPTRVWRGATGDTVALGVKQWLKHVTDERWSVEIAPKLMAAADIGYLLAKRICSYFGSADTADLIARRDPYRLLEVPGIGWETADAVGRAMGVNRDDKERCCGGLVWVLQQLRGEGHSAVPRSLLLDEASRLLGVSRKRLSRVLAQMAVSAEIIRANGLLYDQATLEREWEVASLMRWLGSLDRGLTGQERVLVEAALDRTNLIADQREAVRLALSNGVSVLTGRAGTGKTTVLKTIVAIAHKLGIPVQVVAPTGKAASRAKQVTGKRAFTVHKLLGGPPGSERVEGPIRRGLLIVEEASMLDLEAAAWLSMNVVPGADFRLLIVGDEHQLPSVCHGQVLADLLSWDSIPSVTLTRIRRGEGTSIIDQANRVLDGQPLVLDETGDFRFIELPENPAAAQDTVMRAIARVMEEERTSITRKIENQPWNSLAEMDTEISPGVESGQEVIHERKAKAVHAGVQSRGGPAGE